MTIIIMQHGCSSLFALKGQTDQGAKYGRNAFAFYNVALGRPPCEIIDFHESKFLH